MKIISARDYNHMSRQAANILSAQVILKADSVLGLATGSSPIGTYRQLIQWYEKGDIDLQLLGLGPNGHIGFNEPCDHFPKGTHKVALTDATIQANKRFFEKETDVPRFAYTMGICDIMQANRVVMVVSGRAKAAVVKQAFFGPVTPQVPASILQIHRDFTLVADEDALSEI
ncbi:MAG: glucosamine-6-phosphate deaminase [Oscillospiraceae bacterium]|nr:glucosamine-6-phosphate deaminase [Oscillospiraceae bacterium]